MVEAALINRMVFSGPLDLYWAIGFFITSVLAAAFGFVMWYSQWRRQSGAKPEKKLKTASDQSVSS